jgi:hypothetical protein
MTAGSREAAVRCRLRSSEEPLSFHIRRG